MSHPQQRQFCKFVKRRLPDYFYRTLVADVGSLNINGSNRGLFSRCEYHGIDVFPGRNVDHVGPAHEVLPELLEDVRRRQWNGFRQRTDNDYRLFDVIISTEALEHDKYFKDTLTAIYNSVKQGGLILITAAGDGRPEHGTSKVRPQDSPGTNDYYKNVSNEMMIELYPPNIFTTYHLEQNKDNCDMQFYGLKK